MKVYRFFEKVLLFVLLCLCSWTYCFSASRADRPPPFPAAVRLLTLAVLTSITRRHLHRRTVPWQVPGSLKK